jgi:hypothetical protein
MSNVQRQVEEWAEECRTGQLSRRDLLRRVLLIGGSAPVALALLQLSGVSADAAELPEAPLATRAAERADEKPHELLRCSFCNKDQNDVRKLIAGPTVFICDECIEVCNDIIADDDRFGSRSAG